MYVCILITNNLILLIRIIMLIMKIMTKIMVTISQKNGQK